MVQRVREKAKRPAGRPKEPSSSADVQKLEARARTLEQERDGLKAELEAARQRIAALEENRTSVANRIDWIIESLQGVVQRGD
jgi:outer membrane murein-binding lipoprotein Lpp